MINNKMQNRVLWPALGAALLGVTMAGCGQNATTETTTAPTNTTTQAANDDHGHTHDDEADKAMIASWFPGATVTKKPFPFSADDAAHLSEDSGLKFSGKEGDWGVYEAAKDGQRVGFAVMTHADIPGGEEMHLDFAVDNKFTVIKTDIAKAPDEARMKAFTAQFKGKKLADAWKVEKDLKATDGLPNATAQIAADTVKKGLAILDSNFNAAHGHEAGGHGHASEAPHDESVPHTH